ncbi:hypothetical protein BDV18DRAFT_162213 [Aspergillus unguis]
MVFSQLSTAATLLSFITATFLPNSHALATGQRLTGRAVATGVYITQCYVPGQVALTFDDGPGIYTEELLDTLAAYGAQVTFFVNGYNLAGNEWLLRRIVNEGHQLASHTQDHADLTTLGYDQIVAQMSTLESAIVDAVGVAPRYMRPPYLAIDDYVLGVLGDLDFRVIGASVDTKDYENDDPNLIGNSIAKFNQELDQGGTIVLSHDTHEQTVRTLAPTMLEELAQRGLTAVTVGECLGDDAVYR